MYSASRPQRAAVETMVSTVLRSDPRAVMCERLPQWTQPFLTWLTARPAPGEQMPERAPTYFVVLALVQTLGGAAISAVALLSPPLQEALLLVVGLVLTTSGMGLFQVVVFHHCSHGTVFAAREANVTAGRLVSAILLFKHFDVYKREHMLHHSPNKLLTEEDEFTDFVFGTCQLTAGAPRAELWRKVLLSLVSPLFHGRFLYRRMRAAFCSHDRRHNVTGIGVWAALIAGAAISGHLLMLAVALVLPVSILLQMATVFRILCEHRFPEPELIQARGRDFHCHATAAVFPGSAPPAVAARSALGVLRWVGWWADMLVVQLAVRMLVLVGDAPCHDYHHRRPATRKWTSYIQARQIDLEAGSPGFRTGYSETWGLFRAVDQNLESLSRTPAGLVIH